MRWISLVVLLLLPSGGAPIRAEDTVRLLKVLPHFLDLKGRSALSPSLYERDAYQAKLRQNPALRSGLRFDVQWKGRPTGAAKIRIELRGGKGDQPTTATLELPVKRAGWFGAWGELTLSGEDYKKFGELVAWRATLWDGDRQVAEEKSFLWQN